MKGREAHAQEMGILETPRVLRAGRPGASWAGMRAAAAAEGGRPQAHVGRRATQY